MLHTVYGLQEVDFMPDIVPPERQDRLFARVDCSFRASIATWALNSGVYFLRDVFPIFDNKFKCFCLSQLRVQYLGTIIEVTISKGLDAGRSRLLSQRYGIIPRKHRHIRISHRSKASSRSQAHKLTRCLQPSSLPAQAKRGSACSLDALRGKPSILFYDVS